jgi:hypothetical protein
MADFCKAMRDNHIFNILMLLFNFSTITTVAGVPMYWINSILLLFLELPSFWIWSTDWGLASLSTEIKVKGKFVPVLNQLSTNPWRRMGGRTEIATGWTIEGLEFESR